VLADIVCPEDRGSAVERRHRRADGGRGRARRRLRVAEHAAKRALAREAHEHRAPDRDQLVEPPGELEVVLDRLPEADPRVEAHVLLADSVRDRGRKPLL
jgi:hypothetical protein